MSDLTILYYSANKLSDHVAQNFRERLLQVARYPIISVTQKAVDFGHNICIGEIGQSYYNLYKQMLVGLKEVKTPWVAMAEDDTLYTFEHFERRPSSSSVIAYNRNMWFLDTRSFWTKKHTGTFGCIAPTEYIRDVLEKRYERFPIEITPRHSQKWFWFDPGKDERLGFKNADTEIFETKTPLITLIYYGATYGKPQRWKRTSSEVEELEYWGNAEKLRRNLEGK